MGIGIAKKIDSWIKYDEEETDIGTCVAIHFAVSVSLHEFF